MLKNKTDSSTPPEELIYQVLLINGIMRLGDEAKLTDLWTHEVKKAEKPLTSWLNMVW